MSFLSSHVLLLLSSQVRIMRKRLVRKVFDMIDDIAGRENKEVREPRDKWRAGWLVVNLHGHTP